MSRILFILLMAISGNCMAQITVDTMKSTVTVKEKTTAGIKTMIIYRSLVEGKGMCNQAIYQPTAAEFGEEPVLPAQNFSKELPHIKAMLDAAYKKRQYNFSRFSVNLLPYSDMMKKLAELYTSSKEWNDYLSKANLKSTTKLYDGTEVTELVFDTKIAGNILDKSDFVSELNTFFAQYGYRVSTGGFPDDHQQTMTPEMLVSFGKNSNFIVPVPNNYFILTKLKN